MKLLRIVHLEDDPMDSQLVANLLNNEGLSVELKRVSTLVAFNKSLLYDDLDLILSDYSIPGVDPFTALRLAKEKRPELPFIFLTGTIGEEPAVETLKKGATDYVLKQHMSKLPRAIERAVAESQEHHLLLEAQARLRESEEEYRTTFEQAAVGIAHIDSLGVLRKVNRTLCTLLGRSQAELIGINFKDLTHPEDVQRDWKKFQELVCGRLTSYDIEKRYRLKNGDYLEVLVTRNLSERPSGKIHSVAFVRDITEQKRAEKALQESERQLRLLADAMPQIVWAAGPDGKIDYRNQKWFELVKDMATSPEKKDWASMLHPEDRERCINCWKKSIQTGEPFEVEIRFRFNDKNQYRWYLTRALPVRNENGQIVRWFGSSTDISEIVAARETLARSREELESLIQERTAKLTEMVSELEAFSYSITHDLRSPLRAMQTFASALEEDCAPFLDSEGREYLRRIKLASSRMDELIQDAFDYSLILRQDVPLKRVDIGKLLRDLVQLYPNLQPPGADVRVEFESLEVLGNEAALMQAFSNLLSNAVKFVGPGIKPVVCVTAEKKDGKVLISVVDNGIGIAKEAQQKIFGIFQRLHRTEEYPGTGIGLAMVRKALERIGGKVSLESEPGKGSRFCVELPTEEP